MDDMTATEEEVAQRIFWLKELADIERLEVIDAAQKSKIKWEVEGDENTTFFHGLLNQRRRKQMVQGIMEHGQWHTDPETIKNVFVDFYREKFDAMLERPCSIKEVKAAVWHCGNDKAPGSDGKLPIGCNASFITLIPKVTNLVFVKDYRPISLIGFQYKIIAKMLAMRIQDDKRKITKMKILDVLEQRNEKVRKHLNKAKEKMDFYKVKEKIVMETKVIIIESDTSYDHKPFKVTYAESSDHNPCQATSDESSDHNPF
ncbi:hypothetical protein Tco_0689221 [Tanacetum coccineum]